MQEENRQNKDTAPQNTAPQAEQGQNQARPAPAPAAGTGGPAQGAPQSVQPQPAKANPEMALIGQEISGCVILEKVSSGGMGTVFRAKHKALDRIVCVKILSPLLADDKKAVGLFLTEARAIAEIDHPNIVFVYNVGREKGFYFIVMSYIEGESLSSIVRKKPNLPFSFVTDTFIGILRGLEAAHQKGIIHRDIKPSNILINKKLEPKIVDFGIAKKVDKDKGCAKTTELAGTAYFLSPEQALGRAIDTRADLYSVGASLFYVLTGRYPFTGKNSMEIIQKHINEPVPDVSQYRRGIPPWMSAAVTKLMSKDPKDRFQTATETLVYLQKNRADDQLKVSQGVNIADEVGLKISNVEMGASPRADENPQPKPYINRLNAADTGRAPAAPSKSSIPIVSLGGAKKPAARERQHPVSEEFLAARSSSGMRAMGPKEFEKPKKADNLKRGFVYTLLAAGILLASCLLFLKLGSLCAGYDISGKSFGAALLAPWTAAEYLPGQMLWAGICFVFAIFLLSMFFFKNINKIVFVSLAAAAASYLAAFYGLAPAPLGPLSAHALMPAYAFIFAAMAIKVDENDAAPIWLRITGIALFGAAFYFYYLFVKPDVFEQGPLTASLFYSTLGLMAATAALSFLRGGFFYRMACVLLFAAACASIWVYQASGNVYAILNQLPPAEQRQEEAAAAYQLKDFVYTQEGGPAASAAEQQEEAKEETPPPPAPLTPAQLKEAFINNIRANAANMQRVDIERQTWVFAMQEPFEKFKYSYKREGFVFFAILALMAYGLLAFILALYEAREDRWNLT